jgi:hypothetical protein
VIWPANRNVQFVQNGNLEGYTFPYCTFDFSHLATFSLFSTLIFRTLPESTRGLICSWVSGTPMILKFPVETWPKDEISCRCWLKRVFYLRDSSEWMDLLWFQRNHIQTDDCVTFHERKPHTWKLGNCLGTERLETRFQKNCVLEKSTNHRRFDKIMRVLWIKVIRGNGERHGKTSTDLAINANDRSAINSGWWCSLAILNTDIHRESNYMHDAWLWSLAQ